MRKAQVMNRWRCTCCRRATLECVCLGSPQGAEPDLTREHPCVELQRVEIPDIDHSSRKRKNKQTKKQRTSHSFSYYIAMCHRKRLYHIAQSYFYSLRQKVRHWFISQSKILGECLFSDSVLLVVGFVVGPNI